MRQISKQPFKEIVFAAILTLFFLVGCHKEQLNPPDKIAIKGSTDALFPYSFNWEDPNLNWMPYPSNQAQISPPWTGQGSLYSIIDPDVLTDRKASDGWELLYSTFSFVNFTYNPYFILYNKYRGIMRIFMYVNNTSFASSSYLKNAITLASNQYSILNFAGTDIVDASQKLIRFDKIEAAPKDGSAPFSSFKWYMLQYELAYDPTIVPTTSSTPPQLSFYINSIDVTQVKLGGTVVGKLNGTIGATGPSDLFSTISSNITKPLGTGILAAVGSQSFDKYKVPQPANYNNTLGLPNNVFTKISEGLSGALSASVGNLPGAVTNILSAIIGGNSGSAGQTVSLNLNATISLAGSYTNVTCLPSLPTSFYFPGSLLPNADGSYNVQGYVPLYNKPLGVFNLSNRPTIKIYKTTYPPTPIPGTSDYKQLFAAKLDPTSYQLILNPKVTAIATIQKVTTEIICLNPERYYAINSGRWENYNNKNIVSVVSDQISFFQRTSYYLPTYDDYAVRITFNVVPNNGAPISTIVKTFKTNWVKGNSF